MVFSDLLSDVSAYVVFFYMFFPFTTTFNTGVGPSLASSGPPPTSSVPLRFQGLQEGDPG